MDGPRGSEPCSRTTRRGRRILDSRRRTRTLNSLLRRAPASSAGRSVPCLTGSARNVHQLALRRGRMLLVAHAYLADMHARPGCERASTWGSSRRRRPQLHQAGGRGWSATNCGTETSSHVLLPELIRLRCRPPPQRLMSTAALRATIRTQIAVVAPRPTPHSRTPTRT